MLNTSSNLRPCFAWNEVNSKWRSHVQEYKQHSISVASHGLVARYRPVTGYVDTTSFLILHIRYYLLLTPTQAKQDQKFDVASTIYHAKHF